MRAAKVLGEPHRGKGRMMGYRGVVGALSAEDDGRMMELEHR